MQQARNPTGGQFRRRPGMINFVRVDSRDEGRARERKRGDGAMAQFPKRAQRSTVE